MGEETIKPEGVWVRGDVHLAEVKHLTAEVERLRELHERNVLDAAAYSGDPSHRCDWRVQAEAIAERSKAAVSTRQGALQDLADAELI